MLLYIKYCDGDLSFDTIDSSRVPNFKVGLKKDKKFKISGETIREAQILFAAESVKELEDLKANERIRCRPNNTLESASEIENQSINAIQKTEKENQEKKRQQTVADLLSKKLNNLAAEQSLDNTNHDLNTTEEDGVSINNSNQSDSSSDREVDADHETSDQEKNPKIDTNKPITIKKEHLDNTLKNLNKHESKILIEVDENKKKRKRRRKEDAKLKKNVHQKIRKILLKNEKFRKS